MAGSDDSREPNLLLPGKTNYILTRRKHIFSSGSFFTLVELDPTFYIEISIVKTERFL